MVRMLVLNVEALSSVERARELVLTFARQRQCYGVIDESTTIKNHGTQRTKFVCDQLSPLLPYRRILSGLPTPRSPLDLYHQFEYLDRSILRSRSYRGFKFRYGVVERTWVGNHWVEIVVAYRDTDELYDLIEPHSFRVKLSDVVNIPSDYSFWDVPITPEQKRVYESIRLNATAMLTEADHVTAPMVITQMLRMHQVLLGHTVDEEGKLHTFPERRSAMLMELLETYDGKAVIWFSYAHDLEKIGDLLRKEYGEGSVAKFWGGNRSTREEDNRRFREDPNCRFMLATPGSGGRGREWSAADLTVYYSSTDNLEHRDQSEERVKSVSQGRERTKRYVDMICRNTVEEKIIHNLRKKIDMSSLIVGDDFREWLV
jgi:SNF2 family DNA or RNA helicase